METEELIIGCKKKSEKYQKELVLRYSSLLMTVCKRYSKDDHDAMDILQDGFIEIFNSFGTFDPSKGGLENWMRQIMARTALRRYRKLYMVKETYDKELFDSQFESPDVLDKLEVEEIMQHISNLPDKYKEILNLYVFEDFSHKEISEMLNIDEGSSRSRLSRARKLLIEKMSKIYNHINTINF